MKHIIFLLLALIAILPAAARETYNFNANWHINGSTTAVTLPRAWNENEVFQRPIADLSDSIITYTKTFQLPTSALGKRVFIEFEGVRQAAEVFLNGTRIGLHENGVMAFAFELTDFLREGNNTIEVRVDNSWDYRERATNTPFQWNNKNFNVNYGGITKNVYLHITPLVYQTLPLWSNLQTTGTYIYPSDFDFSSNAATINVESQVFNSTDRPVRRTLKVALQDAITKQFIPADFRTAEVEIAPNSTATLSASARIDSLHFWTWRYGYLYNVFTIVDNDTVRTTTGFRHAEFKNGIVYLNKEILHIHGYAQRTSNEWPGVGTSVPPWLSDYSNNLIVESGGNLVRWMHVCPSKQDIESCDRVGLIQCMPAGDAEKDIQGRQWQQRTELMRDAIIYNRNNPSILFYECGNESISEEHMQEMKDIRDLYDPHGMRAIGSREMLDSKIAEYGGEMLYINKSKTMPMFMMEYCRDECLRLHQNSWSFPFHAEGDGFLYRNEPANAYNHNQDEFVRELVARWHDYYLERPGTGTKCCAGGAKIIFSDTQTHCRSSQNYRVSGVVDAMRIPKDAFYAHQVMWDGWLDDLTPRTHIVGHWNYQLGDTIPQLYVVSNAPKVAILQSSTPEPSIHNAQLTFASEKENHFLFIFKNVVYSAPNLTAIGYDDNNNELSRHAIQTAGAPHHLKITPILNPDSWKADGADLALIQVEVVDKNGLRCPLDNTMLRFSLSGNAEWRGGIAKHEAPTRKAQHNYAFSDSLRVECGITRVLLRSTTTAGPVALTITPLTHATSSSAAPYQTALSPSAEATISLQTIAVAPHALISTPEPRLTTHRPQPFVARSKSLPILSVAAGSGNAALAIDDNENTRWQSANDLDSAWIQFTLPANEAVDEICLKLHKFRMTSYPIAVYAGDSLLVQTRTPKSLSYIRIPTPKFRASSSNIITIKSVGSQTTRDAFGAVKELDPKNNEFISTSGNNALSIIEIEFIQHLTSLARE